MTLNEAIEYLDRNIDQMACEWEPDDLTAVTVLLDAVRMRPATEPPDDDRFVLALANDGPGISWYTVAQYRPTIKLWWDDHGWPIDVISWRELSEVADVES